MIYSAVSQVEAYWEGLRAGETVPLRADINPRGLEDALEYAFILERIAPGVCRFRLAGMHLNELMGMEVRGMPLTAMFQPDAREEMASVLARTCDEKTVFTLGLKSTAAIGRPSIEARMLLAPLRDDFGEVTRVLGCLQSKGKIGRQPHRFDITARSPRAICKPTRRDHTAPTIAGFAEAQRAFVGPADSKGPNATRPALHIIETER